MSRLTQEQAIDIIKEFTTEVSDPTLLPDGFIVSVCLITYQHANFLRQAIDGVLSQKCSFKYEIIVADDGSVDGTDVIALEYQKKYPDRIHGSASRLRGFHAQFGHSLSRRLPGDFGAGFEQNGL